MGSASARACRNRLGTSNNPVTPVSAAKTLRKADGKVLVTDGPYTETKDHIGGLLLLDAADMNAALAWVKKGAAVFGGPVEVREIFYQADPKHAVQ